MMMGEDAWSTGPYGTQKVHNHRLKYDVDDEDCHY